MYAGNLQYSMTRRAQRDTFKKAGEMRSTKIFMDNETGRSEDFNFIEAANDDDQDKAISPPEQHAAT